MKNRFLLIFTGVFIQLCSPCLAQPTQAIAEQSLNINLGVVSNRSISDKLNGFNIVYAKNPDKLWSSGVLKDAIKDAKPGFLRYPGGTVTTYYHWKNPTGNGWQDLWDPEYDTKENLPASEFMNIDEYMNLIKETGALPMVGINVNSGWKWDRKQEAIQEALDLMQYCKDKNLGVKYWYLGNEPYMKDCNGGPNTVAQYAEMINAFVPRMRAFDPDIKIIVNWHATFKKHEPHYVELFKLAGKNIDIVDIHWYCMWGTASWDNYLETTPIGVFTKDSYQSEIELFRLIAAENGYPNIQLASLEWNVGPGKNTANEDKLNPAQSALVQSEMMMQFMIGGLDYATFWPLFWDGQFDSRSFFSRTAGTPYPISKILTIFSDYHGAQVVKTESNPVANTLSFAAKDHKSGDYLVCVLNKNKQNLDVNINLAESERAKIKGHFEFALSEDMQNIDSHEVKNSDENGLTASVSPYSISFFRIADK